MKALKSIKIAFLLNLFFSIVELIGGFLTSSISIITDSIHDFGDACSIAIAMYLEKKSLQKPDDNYTFGYLRFSVLGALITSTFLIVGSTIVFYNAIPRLMNPVEVNYDGMIYLAIGGFTINLIATLITHHKESVNEAAVSLHMLEDVLGWLAVLVGSFLIKMFGWYIVDPILSICIALYILIHVIKSYRDIFTIFLEKAPNNINAEKLRGHLLNVNNVMDIHHMHLWTMDGINNYATVHVLVDKNIKIEELENIKRDIRVELNEHNVNHSVIEFETVKCEDNYCKVVKAEEKHFGHNH